MHKVYKVMRFDGDFTLSELSLEWDCFFDISLLQDRGKLVIGVSPVCARLPVRGVNPV